MKEMMMRSTILSRSIRRQQRMRRFKLIVSLLSLLLILFLVIQSLTHKNTIVGEVNTQFDKEFISIRIEYNDTLSEIANKYWVESDNEKYYVLHHFIEEIKDLNQLNGDRIIAGNSLTIPVITQVP